MRRAKEGEGQDFIPFFTNTTSCRCRSLLPPCVIVCVHTNAACKLCPEPHPERQLLALVPRTVFLFFFPSPPMFWKPTDECFAGRERVAPNWCGDRRAKLVILLTQRESLLIVLTEAAFRAERQGKTWAYPRLPTNTLLYYTLLPAPSPLLALVGLGIYEIFCFAGTENLRLLLNWSMSEHAVGTQYPREQA